MAVLSLGSRTLSLDQCVALSRGTTVKLSPDAVRAIRTYMATTAPAAPARSVFVAMVAIRRSVPARVLPALNPNQPKKRMKVPIST